MIRETILPDVLCILIITCLFFATQRVVFADNSYFEVVKEDTTLLEVYNTKDVLSLSECCYHCNENENCGCVAYNQALGHCLLSNLTKASVNQSLTTATGVSVLTKVCTEAGWFNFKRSCYKLSAKVLTSLDSAVEECAGYGANVTDIVDTSEYDFLLDLVLTLTWENTDYRSVFIGANDIGEEGSFTWIHDGSNVNPDILKWSSGQPNNYLNQDCLMLVVAETRFGLIHDDFCSNNGHGFGVICKK